MELHVIKPNLILFTIQGIMNCKADSHQNLSHAMILQEVGSSRLLRARVKMQEKYLEQYYDLYDDFHIIKLPLLEEEVCTFNTSVQSFGVSAPAGPCTCKMLQQCTHSHYHCDLVAL